MTLIEKHKQLIAWYKKKLGLTDYGFMWIVFFKGILVALVLERLIVLQLNEISFKPQTPPDSCRTNAFFKLMSFTCVASMKAIDVGMIGIWEFGMFFELGIRHCVDARRKFLMTGSVVNVYNS